MDDDITVVKNVKVRYLSAKEDTYNNSICWFKVEKGSINKFSALKKKMVINYLILNQMMEKHY